MESRRFLVLLTHSSRPVELAECDFDYLVRRYSAPQRLSGLPPLTELGSIEQHRHYVGGVSILELNMDPKPSLRSFGFHNPGIKVQHATVAQDRLLVSLQDAIVVLDKFSDLSDRSMVDKGALGRIDDPWFAGVHSACPLGADACIIAASAPDAVLWVDLRRRRVARRQRLPADIYGRNYALSSETDLREHFVTNDLQLGHVNWAWPHQDSVYISALIPGDIGRFSRDGGYQRLVTGFVGCHGVRITSDGQQMYFADSTHGALVLCTLDGSIRKTVQVRSKWLHDVQHVIDDFFVFCVADHNRIDLIDVGREEVFLSHSFDDVGQSLQFVSIIPIEGGRPSFIDE